MDVFVLEHRSQGRLILLGLSFGDKVHGILKAGGSRQDLPQAGESPAGERRHIQTVADTGIRGQDTRPPGVRYNGHVGTSGQRLAGKTADIVEQLFEGFDPEDTGLLKYGIIDPVRTRQ